MTVKELIDRLKEFDPYLPVVYRCCSEWNMLHADEIDERMLQPPRADGWVAERWNDDPNLKTIKYVTFPGN